MPEQSSPDPRYTIPEPIRHPLPGNPDSTGGHTLETHPETRTPYAGSPVIAGYAITGEIARGSMGCVYAGRDLTLDREVAIKTLLPGANAERFVVESKITARLPHPNIPPVHALGRLEDGSPFLAMKLVRGRTLAHDLKACADTKSQLSRYVQVFEQIAQAVGFAHAQKIIHRDLKPANVMVGAFGEVQVMDWGLAKVLEGSDLANGESGFADADTPEATLPGVIMGTPAYMAPEQARGEAVDERADVFALGGILTAILTGQAVFAGTTVRETIENSAAGATADAEARLKTCGADAELVAVAKHCLAANAEDRPMDGLAVAALVAEYRHGVEARLRRAETDKATAQAREQEQRKRRKVMQWAGGAIAAVLVIGMAGTTWGLLESRRQETEAKKQEGIARDAAAAEKAAKEDEATQRAKAEAATVVAQKAEAQTADRLKQIELINDSVFDIFTEFDIRKVKQGTEPVEAVLAQKLMEAGQKLDEKAIADPLVLAYLQTRLGITLLNLGEAKAAIDLFIKARATRTAKLGADHPDTLISMNNLALGYSDAGKLDQALPLLEETLKLTKAKLGTDHPNTLTTMGNLATSYREVGKLDLALPLLEETLKLTKAKLGTDHPDTLTSMGKLATGYREVGKLDLALPLLEETLKLMKAKLGTDHPDTLTSMGKLALGYSDAGKLDQALPLLEETLKLTKARLGADHPNTLRSMNNLAAGYLAAGKLELALPLLEETLKLTKAKLGADHPNTLTSMGNLAACYQYAGKLALALPLYEETLKLRKAKLGADHPNTLTSMLNLGKVYCVLGQGEKAAATLKAFVSGMKKQFPGNDLQFAGLLAEVTIDLLKCDQFATAEPMLRECLAIREKTQPDAWSTFNTQSMLGGALLGQKKYADAEPLLLKGYEGMKQREKSIPPQGAIRIPEALDRLIELYTAIEKRDEVKKWQAERAKFPEPKKPEPKK